MPSFCTALATKWPKHDTRSASVVVAPDARADARDVRSVDVNRDRGRVSRVVDAVDITGRREAADVASMVVAAADHVELHVVELFVLDTLDDAEDAPRHVVVDASQLARPPHEGDDRKRPIGLDVQRVRSIAI